MQEITVTTTADSGPGSLRDAIERANDATGPVTVRIMLDGGPASIEPTTALPPVTFSGSIEGPLSAGGFPTVVLSGASAGTAAGLEIVGDALTVRGLAIVGWDGAGIHVHGCTGFRALQCFVGVDLDGTTARPNARSGIKVEQAGQVHIGRVGEGNVISGNGLYGIEIGGPDSRGAVVVGNRVGTDVAGAVSVANGRSGIVVYNAPDTRIGGPLAGEGNLISGGARGGINLDGSVTVLDGYDYTGKGHARGNLVQGNLIGVDASGERPLGNRQRGVLINYAQDNTVVGNVISGNGEDGVLVLGPEDDSDRHLVPSGNRVVGNLIGVTTSGAACGNGRHGVFVRHGRDNIVGGPGADANVVRHNRGRGVMFSGTGARDNVLGPDNDLGANDLGDFHQPRA
ncbi:right-handed parallel beta-helix repeat-containing protein [Nocardioides stalactiti]|uniref:right-handed parallel beta-helix repeat-containing protein n=1 Tax=Nocardioides stalactiti TaxID=2755356 RepID=UPI001601665F|nr:right-handed parallel beta-helix repeat-containing protein [Nocardioides stalactiti]